MSDFLVGFVMSCRGAFSKRAAFSWFVVVFTALVFRSDWLGVTSLIRAAEVHPSHYQSLLHFFRAASWNGERLLCLAIAWMAGHGLMVEKSGRIVLIGDETKTPKEGRRMPNVKTLRQTSETSSKPSYFRGHEWSVIGVVIGVGGKLFCAPAWARVSDSGGKSKAKDGSDGSRKKRKGDADAEDEEEGRTAQIVKEAAQLARRLGRMAFLLLDAFYANGLVFKEAGKSGGVVVVVTRAKGNCVAHTQATPPAKRGRGRPRKYGMAMKIKALYESEASLFQKVKANIYGRTENVRIHSKVLHWKPAGGLVLFVLAETSKGRITVMCSDVSTSPVEALELYCHRSLVEVMFDSLKNLLGVMTYRFWSMGLEPQTRRPARNTPGRTSENPAATAKTLAAISNFVHIGMATLVFLQALACKFGPDVTAEANYWLRTPSGQVPSELISKIAAGNIIRRLLCGLATNPIAQIIRDKRKAPKSHEKMEDAA
jgi:hypothetical protein